MSEPVTNVYSGSSLDPRFLEALAPYLDGTVSR
jgi:hypothetical protein